VLVLGIPTEKASITRAWHARCDPRVFVRARRPLTLKERQMNSERTSQAISAILRNVDVTEVADTLLARLHLKRRRPAMTMMSTLGLIGLGAVGAFAVVAFVPAIREALTDDPVGRLRAAADRVIGEAEEAALDAEHAVKRKMHDAKETAKGALKGQTRSNNGNKLDV
jgi:hypothetical protein